MSKNSELFSSRWTLILAALGMAIGTGNIWRFPRIVADTGGGAFFIPWILALFIWSIPLLILETAMGRATRRGPVGAFATLLGRNYAWMGGFVALCTSAIMFYYSVVTGWCIRYFIASLGGVMDTIDSAQSGLRFFNTVAGGWEPMVFHGLAIFITSLIVIKGVTKGIERANKFIIPSLLIIMIISAVNAISLPGAEKGLAFLFTPKWETLLDYNTWLQALTQSAWSTGAGWGLMLTYAVYMRQRRGIVINSVITGLGNNSASLLAALVIIPTAFALIPGTLPDAQLMGEAQVFEETVKVLQAKGEYSMYSPASTGMAFVYMPSLFNQMQSGFGQVLMIIFFLALTIAAFSSLLAMLELASRVLIDAGINRKKAIIYVGGTAFLLGMPSAWSLDFFTNQDWVWAVGLMVSGMFITFAAIKYGIRKFRTEIINKLDMTPLGKWFSVVVTVFLPLQFVILLGWWFWQTAGEDWWNPFALTNPGTCLFQWAVAIVFLLLVNKPLSRRSAGEIHTGRELTETEPEGTAEHEKNR